MLVKLLVDYKCVNNLKKKNFAHPQKSLIGPKGESPLVFSSLNVVYWQTM